MAANQTKWLKRVAYVIVAGVLIMGIGDSLWWQDLVAMLTKPKGLVVYVR